MPLKRATSTKGSTTQESKADRSETKLSDFFGKLKRKASSSPGIEDPEEEPSSSKKPKVETEGLSANGQPTNKVLPVKIEFPPKNEGALRISAWNICGLASASKKVSSTRPTSRRLLLSCGQGLKYYVEAEDADIIVLTETKVSIN